MENFKEQLHSFLTSPVLIACIFSWLIAQLLKTFIKLCSGKVHSLSELFELLFWRTGSMPSSHAALVACLSTMIGYRNRNQLDSDVFILSLVFFLVTIRDAMGVRRANGVQARLLNKISLILFDKGLMEKDAVKEVQGHTPLEVFVGCLIGFFIALAFCIL
ncbi:MAG: divergent PAP2 family protein [Treponema sp.]|nr:divergent PAP2 family protein [Treponema sp.]